MVGRKIDPVEARWSFLYEFARFLAIIGFHTLMPVKIINKERLKGTPRPLIVIANHRHALDPLAMALAFPREQIVFLGKKELAANKKWLESLFARIHCILVDRHNRDMEAMRSCMKAVKTNRVLLIFPEGTRHHEGQMEQIETGTSLIAMRSGAPVVPFYFSSELRWFRLTRIYIGDPIPYDDLLQEGINTETCEKMNDRFRQTYREMVKTCK